jgi:hypothetical protein
VIPTSLDLRLKAASVVVSRVKLCYFLTPMRACVCVLCLHMHHEPSPFALRQLCVTSNCGQKKQSRPPPPRTLSATNVQGFLSSFAGDTFAERSSKRSPIF